MVGIEHDVANFQSIKIRDGLEEPYAAHDLLGGIDNEAPSVVVIPEPGLVELPFERGFCRDMEGDKVAAIGNVCQEAVETVEISFAHGTESNHLPTEHRGSPHDAFEAAIHSCNGLPT